MTDSTKRVSTANDSTPVVIETVSPVEVVDVQPERPLHDGTMDMFVNATTANAVRAEVSTGHKLWANNVNAKGFIDFFAANMELEQPKAFDGVVFFTDVRNKPVDVAVRDLSANLTFTMRDGEKVVLTEDQLTVIAAKVKENRLAYMEAVTPSAAKIRREKARGMLVGYLNYYIVEMVADKLTLTPLPGTCELRDGMARENESWAYFQAFEETHAGIGHNVKLSTKWATKGKNNASGRPVEDLSKRTFVGS